MSEIFKTGAAFSDKLLELSYKNVGGLNCTAWITSEPVSFEQRFSGKEKAINLGDKWAQEVFDCAWFRITGTIPESVRGENLVFLINCGGEGLIYDRDGIEKQTITCCASDFDRSLGEPVKRVVFSDGLIFDGEVDFWIDGAANDLFGKMMNDSRFSELCVAVLDSEKRALAYDIQVLASVCEFGSNGDFIEKAEAMLTEIFAEYTPDTIDTATAVLLREKLSVLLSEKNDGDVYELSAVGHSHLDLAWLWPIRETKRKGARTFSTQLMNMERYPGYIFGASQAQLYKWVKECYPRVYEKVKAAAKTPFWEVQGATWVEPDSNLISGESLVRQFYYGKKFFLEEFGQEMKIFWVPDSFGYSACIPQVMKLADVDYFLTQKISWNTVTKFPYHSFKWRGLDGTEVLAHMLPEDTYNGPCNVKYATFAEKNYREREISDISMMLFGIGDGGAGPGFEHLERLKRLENLNGVPKVKPRKAIEFFKLLDDSKTPYPTHQGELYLEKHQGTYTTQSKNKKYNRKCEIALRNYEYLMAAACENGVDLPLSKVDVDEIWQEVLLYQFHDILPGSSINRVYDESVARYEIMLEKLADATKTLLGKLTDKKGFFNFTSYQQTHCYSADGKWYRVELPAMSGTDSASAEEISETFAVADGNVIENDKVRIIFKDGLIVSFFDKQLSRDFAVDGAPMGVYTQYTDEGDCWDIAPVEYQPSGINAVCTAFEVCKDGPKAYAKSTFTVGNSVINQCITLTDGSSVAEIDVDIDCHQQNAMLRCLFPTNVVTDEAAFNIQFGHIMRKTTENTDGEKAQYEVSAQKFVDLSDGKEGIALLNDCKYGYRCKHGVIDVDLVRSPKHGPGENVDQGRNTLRLALYPHAGGVSEDVYKQAYVLNNPVVAIDGTGEALIPTFENGNENVVVEAVKPADDANGFIVRAYNSSEQMQAVKLAFAGYKAAETVGILENTIAELNSEFELKPFELVCIRFVKA